jgi:hypothetical protein
MKLRPFLRNRSEYDYGRTNKIGITNISNSHINYKEYNIRDEMYKRCKEAARCYASIGNIPMMLNKLYSTINLEEKGYNNPQ